MINHTRTIILNKSENIAGISTGLVNAEFIDTRFSPYTFTTSLKQFQDIIYPPGLNIIQRLDYTQGIMTVLHNKQFAEFLTTFDPRITYTTGNTSELFDLNMFIERISSTFLNMPIVVALFHNPDKLLHLTHLYKIWTAESKTINAVIAAFYAYIYQFEQRRAK